MNYSTFKNSLNNVKNSADAINQFLSPISDRSMLESENMQSMKPGNYKLTERTIISNDCYFDYQQMSGNGFSASNENVVDLESELRGITHINSKSDSQKLKKKSKFTNTNNLKVLPYCSDFLVSSETRQQKPCKATSERIIDRFDFPLDLVQVQPNRYIGLNTRLINKKMIEKEDIKDSRN